MTLDHLANTLACMRLSRPVLIAIDGGSAVGKTTLTAELQPLVEARNRTVISASIDDFHRPKSDRYARGRYSAMACYHDTFNYERLRSDLVEPFKAGRPFLTAIFDAYHDRPLQPPTITAPDDALLLFEGVWLMRPELDAYWDYRILITAEWHVVAERGIERDLAWGGTREEIQKLYETRYLPADKLYLDSVQPHLKANVIINNTNSTRRIFTFRRPLEGLEGRARFSTT
jgi:uridine kinase